MSKAMVSGLLMTARDSKQKLASKVMIFSTTHPTTKRKRLVIQLPLFFCRLYTVHDARTMESKTIRRLT
eukprot:scaffold105084_cov67-Attheya_sp.AAC.1